VWLIDVLFNRNANRHSRLQVEQIAFDEFTDLGIARLSTEDIPRCIETIVALDFE
jgi:hypothetical protein